MSATTGTAPPAPATQPPLGLTTKQVLQDIRDNFVMVSAGAVIAGKLVIVLSRHTVFLKDRILYVVPTGDITKFQTSHELITILQPATK